MRTQSRRACEGEPLWPTSAAWAISGVKMSVVRALFSDTALRMAAFLPERDYGCPSGATEGKARNIFPLLLPIVVFQQAARQLPGEFYFFGKLFPQPGGLKQQPCDAGEQFGMFRQNIVEGLDGGAIGV
jgi:hypothetical protein